MPEVTVLLPIYNAGPFLRPAIDSILAQTYGDFELLLIDDASTDGSPDVAASCRDPRVTFVRHSVNRGLGATLNEGLRLARGELVARQDHDDVSDPVRLERQIAAMRQQPTLAMLGSRAHLIDEAGRRIGVVDRPLDRVSVSWYGLFDNPFIHTSVIFRRGIVCDALGGYREQLTHSEDFELWSRLVHRYPADNLRERLVSYRLRARSMTDRIEQRAEGGRFHAEFDRVVRQVVAAALAAEFGATGVTREEADALAGFILGIDRSELDRFLSAFFRLLAVYEARHPEARESLEFRRTLARQVDAVAYRIQPPSRLAALRVYGRAASADLGILAHLPWPRVLALVGLGRAARQNIGTLLRDAA